MREMKNDSDGGTNITNAAAPPASLPQHDASSNTRASIVWQVFRVLLSAGVMDAVMLTALACCSREFREAVEDAWADIRGGIPTTALLKVECFVDDDTLNECSFAPYAPVRKAGPCVVCGTLTRFQHPIEGAKLYPACGKSADKAKCWSPLYQYKMIVGDHAFTRYAIHKSSPLKKHLRYALRLPVEIDMCERCKRFGYSRCECGRASMTYDGYAPYFAESVASALTAGLSRPSGPRGDGSLRRVYLRRDLGCLMLELFGGPKMVQERIRNLDLNALCVDNPDA